MKRPDKIHRAAIEAVAAGRIPTSMIPLRDALEEAFPGAIARAAARHDRAKEAARFIGPVPAWAKRFVLKHGRNVDTLTIRQSRTKPYSSGHCKMWSGDLVVTFGAPSHLKIVGSKLVPREKDEPRDVDEIERKTVVLHEIAHANSRDLHGVKFYRELRRLLVAEGLLRAYEHRHGKIRARRVAAARP